MISHSDHRLKTMPDKPGVHLLVECLSQGHRHASTIEFVVHRRGRQRPDQCRLHHHRYDLSVFIAQQTWTVSVEWTDDSSIEAVTNSWWTATSPRYICLRHMHAKLMLRWGREKPMIHRHREHDLGFTICFRRRSKHVSGVMLFRKLKRC